MSLAGCASTWPAGISDRADGGHRFVRDPIVTVGENAEDGRVAVVYARVSGRLRGRDRLSIERRSDLNGPFTGVGWRRCYYQVIADSLSSKVRVGARVRVGLIAGEHTRDRAFVRVRRGRGFAPDISRETLDRRFRELGCSRQHGV